MLQDKGITSVAILRYNSSIGNPSYQSAALHLIVQRCEPTYYAQSTVNQKLVCWKLIGIFWCPAETHLSQYELSF